MSCALARLVNTFLTGRGKNNFHLQIKISFTPFIICTCIYSTPSHHRHHQQHPHHNHRIINEHKTYFHNKCSNIPSQRTLNNEGRREQHKTTESSDNPCNLTTQRDTVNLYDYILICFEFVCRLFSI